MSPQSSTMESQSQSQTEYRRLLLPNRHKLSGDLYKVISSEANTNSGRTFILQRDLSREAQSELFNTMSTKTAPSSLDDAIRNGYLVLDPLKGDRVFVWDVNNIEGGEVLLTWGVNPSQLSPEDRKEMEEVRELLLGDEDKIDDQKPRKEDGQYRGGIAFERSDHAICVFPGNRAYFCSLSVQQQKTMIAPGAGNKRPPQPPLDPHIAMKSKLVKVGGKATARGLDLLEPALRDEFKLQADLSNLPLIGHSGNTINPSMQLNVSPAVDPGSQLKLSAALGQFGGIHIDGKDSSTAPTALTSLTKPHPDVPTDIFCIVDMGIAWIFREFSTVFFSGLHLHTGIQLKYNAIRTDPSPYTRLNLVGYPPSSALDKPGALAFAALPNGKCLEIGYDMRDPRRDPLTRRFLYDEPDPIDSQRPCEQATMTHDGGLLLDRQAYLDHLARNFIQLLAGFGSQVPPEYGFMFDRDLILSAFSILDEGGARIYANPWPLGPGWLGSDVGASDTVVGSTPIPGSDTSTERHPTGELEIHEGSLDSIRSQVPYNNPERIRGILRCEHMAHEKAKTIPICAMVDERHVNTGVIIGPVPSQRRATLDQARRQYLSGILDGDTIQITATSQAGHPTSTNSSVHSGLSDTHSTVPLKRKRTDLHDDGTPANHKKRHPKKTSSNRKRKGKDKQVIVHPIGSDEMEIPWVDVSSTIGDNILEGLELKALNTYSLFLAQDDLPCPADDLSVDKVCKVLQDPQKSSTLPHLLAVSKYMQKLSSHSKIGNTHIRSIEAMSLLSNMVLWEWVEHITKEPPSWLMKLWNQVSTCLATPLIPYKLEAAQFLTELKELQVPDYSFPSRQHSFSSFDKGEIVDKVVDILSFWLQFPNRSQYQPQAWFVRHIISYIGVEAVLLPCVSWAAGHLNTYVLGRGIHCKIKRQDLDLWASSQLCRQPVTRSCTLEHDVVLATATTVVTSVPSLGSPLSAFTVTKPQIISRTEIQNLLDLYYLTDPLLKNPDLSLTLPHGSSSTYGWKSLLKVIQGDPDQLLLFRDLATSRKHILKDNSPFSPPNLVTVTGFFKDSLRFA
ncbi:hypothetical protein BDN72DRAFT_905486 [Pluteus cervinus]|uniref:Uncharacterized protein n=1 Tax=Pluteus cervinus TaxID=181527 RepID=A0ACD3A1U8_9AGAR|nr:hypothetical protein BDN72DRAFT_905486 [Pluteus cervinus]